MHTYFAFAYGCKFSAASSGSGIVAEHINTRPAALRLRDPPAAVGRPSPEAPEWVKRAGAAHEGLVAQLLCKSLSYQTYTHTYRYIHIHICVYVIYIYMYIRRKQIDVGNWASREVCHSTPGICRCRLPYGCTSASFRAFVQSVVPQYGVWSPSSGLG